MCKQYYVYITTNSRHTVLYTGITSDLIKRIYQHKNKLMDGFTKKYNVDKLIYYEIYQDPTTAIQREKSIKNLLRVKKEALVSQQNPEWIDLSYEILSSQ